MRTTRVLAIVGLTLAGLLAASPATALSCIAAPPDLAEVTITGDIPDEGWHGEVEVPVVIGRVTVGTAVAPEEAGDRLALVEVIGGLRLDDVPAQVAIVADGLIGWGHTTYTAGEHVFLRIDEWNVEGGDLTDGIADGPCSWNQRYSEAEINDLLLLAEEHGILLVEPTPIIDDESSESTTTSTTTSTPRAVTDDLLDDAEPIAVAEPETAAAATGDDGISTVVIVVAALAGLALLGASAYTISSRR